jgi:NAD-dependent dihydropyrimidine dehydrogenase PreA subunit
MGIKGINYEKCIGCGYCYIVCPRDCFAEFGGVYYIKYPEDCMTCFQCALACKVDACLVDHTRNGKIPLPPLSEVPFKRSKSARLCTGRDFPAPYIPPPNPKYGLRKNNKEERD